jgi:integrase
VARSASAPFVADVVHEFLRTKATREESTRRAYFGVLLGSEYGTKPSLGLPLAAYFKNRRMNTVLPDEVVAWFAQRVRDGAQDTKSRISRMTRGFFRFAFERGYSEFDLGSGIEHFNAGGPRVDWLEWPDVHRVLGAIPEFRFEFAAAWLFFTGCRVGEACAAKQEDVRWREDAGLFQWSVPDSKTHRPRSVWLPDVLVPYIEQSREQNRPTPHWPVLWDCDGRGRGFGRVEHAAHAISPRTINSALERARDELQLPFRLTAHIARHTYCTNWVREHGASELMIEKLSRQVGTSVGVLRKTYIHYDLDQHDWAHLKSFGALAHRHAS